VGFPVGLEDDMAELTQGDVASLTDGMHRFARGLFLQVRGPDAKSWIYRYTVRGVPRWMGLGSARDITLAVAKSKVEKLRVTMVAQKIDPIAEEEKRAQAERHAKDRAVPFRKRAEQYIAAHGWRSAKHLAQWKSSLETYVYDTIGDLSAHEVTGAHVVEILRPIWTSKAETARRVRGRIEAVLDYAADPDDEDYRNPAAMTPRLAKALPKPGKRRVKHHAALPYAELPEFMAALAEDATDAARMLRFIILTACRYSEAAKMQPGEVSGELWTIPADRMKAEKEHKVPLSTAAMACLPVPRVSDVALANCIRRHTSTTATTHGFRSTFRDWVGDCTDFPRELAEMALAHEIDDDTEAAYRRGKALAKRQKLMESWAQYCGTPSESGKVVPIRGITLK
jgi:integrase